MTTAIDPLENQTAFSGILSVNCWYRAYFEMVFLMLNQG